MTKLSIAIPDYWLNRTDQSVHGFRQKLWLELTGPWRPEYQGMAGVWTNSNALAATVPAGVKAAGPLGSGLPGVLVGGIGEIREVGAAEFLFVNSEDAAGPCGREGVFVLLQAAAEAQRPAVVRGGVGPELLAAAKLLDIDEVLAEEFIWPALAELPERWRQFWQSGAANETRAFGKAPSLRFWARPGFAVTREAAETAERKEWPEWLAAKRADLDQQGPKDRWLAAGGATGLAARLGVDGDLASRLNWLEKQADALVAGVSERWPWRQGVGYALDAGVNLPISQGPMANVADVPAFAAAVAKNGAFPWFALASTPEKPVRDMLQKAKSECAGLPYGAGLIGMATNPMLDMHIALCKEFGMQWLLVAAANVEMALRLEREGFKTLLHTPAPEMLGAAIDAGLKRFVWEGREAGGHVGVLSSASLWQQNLAVVRGKGTTGLTVLLAGGLGPRAAAVAAAPWGYALENLGQRQGLQLGSAYLKTVEAQQTGAIAPTYRQALNSAADTVVVGEASGAPTRLLATAKAQQLASAESRWVCEGMRTSDRKHAFEKENFGGLRLAAKAQKVVVDERGPRLEAVPHEEAMAKGLFHMGVVGGLQSSTTIAGLHADTARPFYRQAPTTQAPQVISGVAKRVDRQAIAIVGMGFRLPGAESDEQSLWSLLRSGLSVVDRLPDSFWNRASFLDEATDNPHKVYTDLAATIAPPPFDGKRYRIPPKVVAALDATQTLAIELTAQALANANYPDLIEARAETDVILGVAQGDMRIRTDARILLEALAPAGLGGPEQLAALQQILGFSLPPPSEDSMPGELANVTAGRVAAVFNFNGANFTADAACASALAAINTAVDRLRLGRCDWAVTGGVDRNMGIGAYVKFCRLGALSKTGSFPFDRRASGFVMGEGGAVFVLRRLSDALRDGNRIRAVIAGTGLSSDGKGKGITAPNPAGQALAIKRALRDAGIDASGLGAVEAHGTGTKVGDQAEVETLRDIFSNCRQPLGIGSIKGNIGHLKAAAGAAALAKSVLALEHRQLPPSGNYAQPRAELQLTGQPLYVVERVEAWSQRPARIGINSFGFGGTDAHLVVVAGDSSQPSDDLQQLTTTIEIAKEKISMDSETTGQTAKGESGPAAVDKAKLEQQIAAVVAAATGYDAAEIEPHLEFEGDLGIDTVKIAEVIGLVRERFHLPDDPDLVLSSVGSVDKVAAYVATKLGESSPNANAAAALPLAVAVAHQQTQQAQRIVIVPEARAVTLATPVPDAIAKDIDRDAVRQTISGIVAEATGYDIAEIEPHLEFEGDLGIDTVKIAEVIGLVREHFDLPDDPDLVLSSVQSVDAVAAYVLARRAATAATAATAAQAVTATVALREPAAASQDLPRWRSASDYWQAICAGVVNVAGDDSAAILENLRSQQSGHGRLRFAAERERFDLDKAAAGFVEAWDLRRWQRAGAAVGEACQQGFAMLFPGQGTQQAGMLAELRGIDVIEQTIAEAAAILDPILGVALERFLSAPPPSEKAAIEAQLTQTRFTQPVLLTVEIALYRLLEARGIRPAAVGGHSLGEFAACVAAGVLSFSDALRIVSGRGQAMEEAAAKIADPGAMVAVGVDAKTAVRLVAESGIGGLELANQNSPTQTVIGGATAAIDALCARLAGGDLPHKRLNVSHAFHTSIVAAASQPLAELLANVQVNAPILPIYSNVTAQPYPNDVAEIKHLLAVQLARPVRFVEMIEGMNAMGVAGFIEVGAGRVLSNLAGEISPPHVGAWPCYLPGKASPQETLAKLWTGVCVFSPLNQAATVKIAPTSAAPARKKKLPPLQADDLVISGMAAGIPGEGDPFAAAALDALLRGENRIQPADEQSRAVLAQLGIEHVAKDANGAIRTQKIDNEQAGVKFSGRFAELPDLTPYGVSKAAQNDLDATSRYAIAAGFKALEDAGLPLVARDSADKYGSQKRLPDMLASRTGIIFGSVFAGVDEVIKTVSKRQPFSRTFLVEMLGLAHSHFARFIGATGPAIQISNACASTVGALALAEDWLKCGRADRVIVIAADVAGGPDLLPYVGGGFLAVGAASTEADLEKAAQPFGIGRGGTIIGSGAVAFVVERAQGCTERGVRPRARLLGANISNDACHPLKMNPTAIAGSLQDLLGRVEAEIGFERVDVAENAFFVSHEPFTPAKGGSADSEAAALRAAFGARVGQIVVSNVKGYTGHPMGASLEDVVAIAGLERGVLPPVRNANLQDPALADLQLSKGQAVDAELALHLAAGFGAQICWVIYGRVAGDGPRLDEARHQQWLAQVGAASVAANRFAEVVGQAPAEHAAPKSRVEICAPAMQALQRVWRWQPLHAAAAQTAAELTLAEPLVQRPLGADDVVDVVNAWRRRLQAEPPSALCLPYASGDTWTDAAAEALAGMTRSFLRERPEQKLRLVWLSDQSDVTNVASALAASDAGELLLAGPRLATPLWLPLPNKGARAGRPAGNWLLVGGGRGITALLAKRWAMAGMDQLWLVGRRPEPDASVAELSDEAIRDLAKERLAGERNPKKFQAEVERLQADRELAGSLADLRATGAKIVYLACDVADAAAVRGLARLLRESGTQMAGVVHAGGVEHSAAIERLDDTDVERVAAAKLHGTQQLVRLCKTLAIPRLVAFGSIANAVGNAGQTAYAAANGALKALTAASGLQALTIEWSAWAGAGMATRGAIPKLLAQQGVEFLQPDDAFSELEALLADSQTPKTVMVARSLGRDLGVPELPVDAAAIVPLGPSDAFVDHHRIQGEAVFPGVFAVELLWRTFPSKPAVRIDFERAVRFVGDRDLSLAIANQNGGGYLVEHDEQGRAKRKPAYVFHWCTAPAVKLGDWSGELFCLGAASPDEIYRHLFHGPKFQVLNRAYWNECHAWAESSITAGANASRMRALAIEAMLQLGGLWAAKLHGVDLLPVQIECATPDRQPESLTDGVVRIALAKHDGRDWHFEGEWLNAQGAGMAACFVLRETGRIAPIQNIQRPAIVLAERDFAALAKLGEARSHAHKDASLGAWECAVAKTQLGLLGAALPPPTSPPPGAPLTLADALLYWSRSHSDGRASAAVLASRASGRVGVDIEALQERSPAFWRECSNANERERFGHVVDAQTATAIWAAKEASLKALGAGLSLPLAEIEVVMLQPEAARIQLLGGAANLAAQAGLATEVAVQLQQDAGYVRALAHVAEN